MNYHSINDLVELCHKNNAQIWQVIMMDNAHERIVSEDKIFENMRLMYKAMKTADNNYDKSLKSPSRMAGGDGELMYQYNKSGRNICGDFVGMVMEKALKMGESNACMRRIVAAPTAGSCGVIPAVFISYETYFKALEDDMVKALLIASGIGAVIAENASIAGASGGCQAEIGSASAMAAAGLTFLQGGDSLQIVNSSALALKSMLGLACDPVCGLVEVPCIKRNVAGAMNAITAAQMSMAGIKSARLEKLGKLDKIITQNIDGLHQMAGSTNVIELHGATTRNYCEKCGKKFPADYIFESREAIPRCVVCNHMIRPDVTLYGEQLPAGAYESAVEAIRKADMLIVAGTSLKVYPAAGLVWEFAGKHLVVMNKEPLDFKLYMNKDIEFNCAMGDVFRALDKNI